jgi:hypothetical protein
LEQGVLKIAMMCMKAIAKRFEANDPSIRRAPFWRFAPGYFDWGNLASIVADPAGQIDG